jgi:hypothetical protein
MRIGIIAFALGSLPLASPYLALAQDQSLQIPKSITAGDQFSIQSAGSGKAALYIVGPNQVLERDIVRGGTVSFAPDTLQNAGRYLVILKTDDAVAKGEFEVVAASRPSELSFLARPSRLPIGLHDGITGAVYVFDAYRNLITMPAPVTFELSSPSGAKQTHVVETHNGAAFTEMDSTTQQGSDNFVARVDDIESTRVVGQIPGDPCGIKMTAQPSGQQIRLETAPLRDCSGNAVPDGTIVTFTETYGDAQTTVDVPLKRGIAQIDMPVHNGATLSAASGVVLGNQIHWEKR